MKSREDLEAFLTSSEDVIQFTSRSTSPNEWDLPSSEEVLEPLRDVIGEMTRSTVALIEQLDAESSRITGRVILSYGEDTYENVCIARNQAIHNIFILYGVNEMYENPQDFPFHAKYVETDRGWETTMLRPDGKGEFRLKFSETRTVNTNVEVVDRRNLFYSTLK